MAFRASSSPMTLAGPLGVTGTFWQDTQPVSVASQPLAAGAAKDSTLTDGTLRVGGTVATGGLTDAQLRSTALPVAGAFWQATQPMSAASLPLPTGAATETTLAAVNTKLGGTLAVSGPLTDTQLRAVPVPISAAALPLPSGAATDAELAILSGQLAALALDTTLTANIGKAGDGSGPAAYTVLDQLGRIRKAVEQNAKTALAVLDASRPKLAPPRPLTLLHGR